MHLSVASSRADVAVVEKEPTLPNVSCVGKGYRAGCTSRRATATVDSHDSAQRGMRRSPNAGTLEHLQPQDLDGLRGELSRAGKSS